MTVPSSESPSAPAAKPFNRRLLAQGRALPPGGEQRVPARAHFATQERIGFALALAALYGVVYGVRLVFANGPDGAARGDFVTPLYVVLGVAVALAAVVRLAGRGPRRSPRPRRARRDG
ncbi:MAG: hypothetical protein ACON4Z_09215 [Planctomycetota bacterium]